MAYSVAVVGATGNVGREMLNILAERMFPVGQVHAVASRRSLGQEVSFGDRTLKCEDLEQFDFSKVQICFMAAGSSVAQKWAEKIGAAGCLVIDNSSFWRYHDDVPLIVPEVNPDAIMNCQSKNIIANPNCSTAQMVVALKPLHDRYGIKRVVVSTYQSVSGSGKDGMDELFAQTRSVFVGDPKESQAFTKQIAFNVIPHIDIFMDSGDTKEEWKMIAETAKILDPSIRVTATCVRVPVFVGHSESVNVELHEAFDEEDLRSLLRESPGLIVVDKREDGGYITPVECVGEYATYISRIRRDVTVDNGVNLWCVSDNLRKGAALNAIQIAELAINRNIFAVE